MTADLQSKSLVWKIRKVVRYVRLFGPRRTLAKVRAQQHLNRRISIGEPRTINANCVDSIRSPPDTSRMPFPRRSPRRSSANAARGGLKPPPQATPKGHTFISWTAPSTTSPAYRMRTPFDVRDTRPGKVVIFGVSRG